MKTRWLKLLVLGLAVNMVSLAAYGERIKDIATVAGVRTNQLVGYGLVVGLDLRIRNYNSTVLYGTYEDGGILKRGKFDIAMYAWLSSPEPASKEAIYSGKNIPPNGQNNPRIDNEELTTLLERASNEVDEETRIKLYKKISDMLVTEAPVIPLFWYTSVDACIDGLMNFKPNPTQSADSWNAQLWYLKQSK